MRLLALILVCIFYCHALNAQVVYQGLVVPDAKGRFGNASPITQASGLALDENGVSLWTHNDQGNPTTVLYKILTAIGNETITIEKEVDILNVENLDWEDMAKDDADNVYVCQVGKNCNALSDSLECPTRYIFKIHKLSLASLNHPDSVAVTPETFYFKYPLTGYDVENCDSDDTVFVNCEAVIWHDDELYLFTKNIWSKYTNNCGGWITGYTYMFKLSLTGGSSMENPLVAEYVDKVNLRLSPTEPASKYQVTAAAISPDESILVLITYNRIWQFRNFTGDDFFLGSSVYNDYSNTGTDTITRGYEGVEFMDNRYVTLCVDGANGRISGIDLDSLAIWVRNPNDTGPGTVRNSLLAATAGDTIRFLPHLINDTIQLTSAPLTFSRNVHLIQPNGQPIYLRAVTSNVMAVPAGSTISIKNVHLICGNTLNAGVINDGTLSLANVNIYNAYPVNRSVLNTGDLIIKGVCWFYDNE